MDRPLPERVNGRTERKGHTGKMDFGPISRNTLPDTIIEEFRRAIEIGRFKPGDRVPSERELADMFKVGRTSIREAMKALSILGLIRRTNEGTYVGEGQIELQGGSLAWKLAIQRADLAELFETRLMFECNLVELAAARSDDDDLAEIRATLQVKDDSVESFLSADMAFHSAIAAAAKNTAISELYSAVKGLLFRSHDVLRSAWAAGRKQLVAVTIRQTSRDHGSLLACIERRDPLGARRAMKQHLDRTRQRLSELAGLLANGQAGKV